MTSTTDTPSEHEVVILGAGMSGLCTAIQLRLAGQHDFVVLEKSSGLGGTWWDNRYPGAHVDVPAPLYCFSFEPNPRWQRRFAAAPEIADYMAHCAQKYGVTPHLRLRTCITAATFDEARGRWLIDTVCDGQERQLSARFFVCSTGPLSQARWPAIEGLDSFAGPRLHSARWDASLPLAGKRVAVIGTGSTAAQLIPPIAQQAAQLHVFQRTANWVLPRIDRPYFAVDRLLARVPGVAPLVRQFWMRLLEWGRRGFDEGSVVRRGMLKAAELHLRRAVLDPALAAKLRPHYALGCKRLMYSNDYYPALARANVELVTQAITRVTPQGIVTADGQQRDIDVLVCATGFDVQHSMAATPVRGCAGHLLSEVWHDGPHAHLGLTVAGFPNLFLMLGPNTATGHTSTLLYIEPGVQWALRAMQEVTQRGKRWLDVKPSVMAGFNSQLQARLSNSVWSGCRSWYRVDGGPSDGKNIAIWPGFTREYVQAVQRQSFDDFVFG
jgi:cation diffusion facilitator CzcD-associated flavoprotein CzcO